MQRLFPGHADASLNDVVSRLEAGEDPRVAIARINAKIVAFQRAGEDVPAGLLRLSMTLASECVSQSQGR